MAKTRTYTRDLRGRFAHRKGRRSSTKRSISTSLGFSAGLIETRGVRITDARVTLRRRPTGRR